MWLLLTTIYSIVAMVLYAPIIALLLFATTFVSNITFSWVFVIVVSGVLAFITGGIIAAKES